MTCRAGFLGHWLLKDLHSRYGSSAVLFSSSRSLRFPSPHRQWLPCDLTSSTSIAALLSQTGAKTVILAAASHFESTREEAFRVNVTGTQTVVDACRQAGVKRFVYTSSTAAIFAGKSLLDAKEDETPYVTEENLQSYYGLSKAKGEIITMQANGKDGMYTTAIRPASFTGCVRASVCSCTAVLFLFFSFDVLKRAAAARPCFLCGLLCPRFADLAIPQSYLKPCKSSRAIKPSSRSGTTRPSATGTPCTTSTTGSFSPWSISSPPPITLPPVLPLGKSSTSLAKNLFLSSCISANYGTSTMATPHG